MTTEMFKHCRPLDDLEENPLAAALLLTEEAAERYGLGAFGFYKFKGLVQELCGAVRSCACSVLCRTWGPWRWRRKRCALSRRCCGKPWSDTMRPEGVRAWG